MGYEKYNIAKRRGIIYTGLTDHLKNIYQSISAHRALKNNLPIEVWMNERDEYLCKNTLEKYLMSVTCKFLSNSVSGFSSKFYALLSTTLTDVLFMDADNIAVRDVNEIFDSKYYKDTGVILWPDLYGNACQDDIKYNNDNDNNLYINKIINENASFGVDSNGYTSYSNHIIWKAHFGGLNWINDRDYAHDTEAGQLAIDISRHTGLLELGRKMIEDKGFLKNVVYGDKDIFRLIFLITGEKFYNVPYIPSMSYTKEGERDCIVHYFHHIQLNDDVSNIDNYKGSNMYIYKEGTPTPMFFHQLKQRDKTGYSFKHVYSMPKQYKNVSSVCYDFKNKICSIHNNKYKEYSPLIEEELQDMSEYYDNINNKNNINRIYNSFELKSISSFVKLLFNYVDNNWIDIEQPFKYRLMWIKLRTVIIYYKRKLGLLL